MEQFMAIVYTVSFKSQLAFELTEETDRIRTEPKGSMWHKQIHHNKQRHNTMIAEYKIFERSRKRFSTCPMARVLIVVSLPQGRPRCLLLVSVSPLSSVCVFTLGERGDGGTAGSVKDWDRIIVREQWQALKKKKKKKKKKKSKIRLLFTVLELTVLSLSASDRQHKPSVFVCWFVGCLLNVPATG